MTVHDIGRNLPTRELVTEAQADPAAGAEFTVTVPAGEVWELLGVYSRLACDATVANRRPHLTIDDGTLIFGKFTSSAVQTASSTWSYVWSYNVGYSFATSNSMIGLPKLLLPAGYRVRSTTDLLQAADNWEAPNFHYIRWSG